MKSAFLRKILSLIIATIMCSFLLTAGIYTVTARRSFNLLKSDELEQRASLVVQSYLLYTTGALSGSSFEGYIDTAFTNWNVRVHIYDKNGSLITKYADKEMIRTMNAHLETVLSGETIRDVPNFSFYSEGSVLVGVPAILGDVVYGAIFLIQPVTEITPAINSMTLTLVSSMLIVAGFMGIFSLFASQRFARPINRMRDIALDMASGDFDVRADEGSRDEIGQLGRSLNFMAAQLSSTIDELILERNRLRSILDGLNEGILALDAEGNITHVNPALQRIFGYIPLDENEEIPREQLIDDPSLWQDFDLCIERALPVVRSYQRGSAIYRLTVSPLTPDESRQEAVGAVALFYDVTQSERLEQTRREYVANVSHELRTPISAVRGLAEALNDGLIKDEDRRSQYYGYILRESVRMSRLIDDLLELSRLQSGSTSVELSRVPLGKLLPDVVDRYTIRAEEVGIDLELDENAANAPDVFSNADRIEQVLIILLDNALKFAPEDSAITVGARWNNEKACVSVRDHGPGVDPNDIEHIFDRFYKADKSHSGGGTGLGLAIAKEALMRMDETIKAENMPDGGARFTFTLTRWPEDIDKDAACDICACQPPQGEANAE